MSSYTREELDDLQYKQDVVDIAEELGLDTEGTRAEVTDRILAAQDSAEPEPTPEPTPEPPAPEPATVPEEAAPPLKPIEVGEGLKNWIERTLSAYFGKDLTKAIKDKVAATIAKGGQVCLVEGEGNKRFDLEYHDDTAFAPLDPSNDVAGGILNLTRRAFDAKVYPFR